MIELYGFSGKGESAKQIQSKEEVFMKPFLLRNATPLRSDQQSEAVITYDEEEDVNRIEINGGIQILMQSSSSAIRTKTLTEVRAERSDDDHHSGFSASTGRFAHTKTITYVRAEGPDDDPNRLFGIESNLARTISRTAVVNESSDKD